MFFVFTFRCGNIILAPKRGLKEKNPCCLDKEGLDAPTNIMKEMERVEKRVSRINEKQIIKY